MVLGTMVGLLIGALGGFVWGPYNEIENPAVYCNPGHYELLSWDIPGMYDGQPINISSYRYLGEGNLLGIPISVFLFLWFIVFAGAILRFTRFGRHTYAIGSNVEAAHHAGVKVDRNLVGIYTLGGLLTGLGAMIAMSRTVSAQPTAGIGAELDIIAAVVIGGASLSGGSGTVTGTLIGTLLISFLRNGCTLLGFRQMPN